MSSQRPRFYLRCRADIDLAPPYTDLEANAKARFDAAPKDGKVRRFRAFLDGATSWSRVERIIARVEVDERTRHTLHRHQSQGSNPRGLYEQGYCRRGQAENHIKSWKTHLAADRTSCTRARANQLRLFLHAGAYWMMWGLRASMPKRSIWRASSSTPCACASSSRRPRRRNEDHDQAPSANSVSCSSTSCATPLTASRASSPERRGKQPRSRTRPCQPANIFHPNSGSPPERAEPIREQRKAEKINLIAPPTRAITVKALHNAG